MNNYTTLSNSQFNVQRKNGKIIFSIHNYDSDAVGGKPLNVNHSYFIIFNNEQEFELFHKAIGGLANMDLEKGASFRVKID